MAVTTVPKKLREKLGEDGADALTIFVNAALDDAKNGMLQIVEERFARRLAEEIGNLRAEMHEALSSQRTEMHGALSSQRTEMHGALSSHHAEMHEALSSHHAEMHEALSSHHTELLTRMANLETNIREKIANVSANFKTIDTEFRNVRSELNAALATQKAELLRWMFIFWITQMAAFLTIVWKVLT